MEEILVELEIPLYIRSYISSESIRPKYYQRGKKKVPEKYRNKDHCWGLFKVTENGKKVTREFLIKTASKERIIFNGHLVGKQNIKNINGQDIYNGNVAGPARNKLMSCIKNEFKKYIKPILPISKFPIRINIYLFDTILDDEFSNGQDWDVDNRFFPYGKAFADVLKHEGKIPDDNRYYITEPPHAIFVPVHDTQDRKLVVRIYKDNRPIILENYLYQKKHGEQLK